MAGASEGRLVGHGTTLPPRYRVFRSAARAFRLDDPRATSRLHRVQPTLSAMFDLGRLVGQQAGDPVAILERDDLLAVLRHDLDAAARGDGSLVFIAGE